MAEKGTERLSYLSPLLVDALLETLKTIESSLKTASKNLALIQGVVKEISVVERKAIAVDTLSHKGDSGDD